MKIIGLTGGIASGKSTASAILKALGARIIDADQIAREVVAPGSEALDEIVKAFGTELISDAGTLKRSELAQIVFNDPIALKRLNAITHPRIIAEIEARIKVYSDSDMPIVVDAALLIELNLGNMVDETWLLCVRPEIQIDRLIKREGMSCEDAVKIIGAQLPLEEKMKAADVCIDNNGSQEALRASIEKLWNAQVST